MVDIMVLSLRVLVLLLFLILQVPCHAQEEEQIVFGEKVSSPFSWMDKLASPRVQKWLELQETNQEDYFKRSDFKKLNSILYTPKRQEFKETTRYRFEMITGAKTPPKLKVKENIANPEIRTLIRCNDFKLSKHDFPSIEEYWVADSELFLVAAVSHSGSDWLELLVYDLEKMNLIDTLKGVINPGIIFHGNGFYYERYDEPDDLKSIRFNQRISFHEFNSSQKDDRNVFVNNDPSSIRSFGYTQLDDTRFIYVFHPIKIKDAWKEAITKIELGNFSPLRPFFIYSSPPPDHI